jgi:hypothetical protein
MSPTFFSTSKTEEEEDKEEDKEEEEVKKKKTRTLIKVKNVLKIIAEFVGNKNNPTCLLFFPSFSLFLSLCSGGVC